MRTALYVVLVAAGVFAGLQAHQFLVRKRQEPPPPMPATGRHQPGHESELDLTLDAPAEMTGMIPVAALPPVDMPPGSDLWFALGRPSIEPGHVQLVWLHRGDLTIEEVESHYRKGFQTEGYVFQGVKDADDRRTLVFTKNGQVAVVTLRTEPEKQTMERFVITLNRPAREGDFVARPPGEPSAEP
jgi:hypothetical protein